MAEAIEWRSARLRSVRDLTPDIRLFEIEPAGRLRCRRRPAAISISWSRSTGGRSAQLFGCRPLHGRLYRIAVKRLPDSRGRLGLHVELGAGRPADVSTPGNHFELSRGRPEYLLLAGGIGITPIFTMALALAQAEQISACSMPAAADKIWRWRTTCGTGSAIACEIFISDEGERVDIAAEIARLGPDGEFYVCGPIGMLEAAKRALAAERPSGRSAALRNFWQQRSLCLRAVQSEDPAAWPEIDVPRQSDHARRARGAGY